MRRISAIILICGALSGCAEAPRSLDAANNSTRPLGDWGFFGVSGKPAPVAMSALGTAAQTAAAQPYVEFGRPGTAATPQGDKPIGIEPGGQKMTLQFVNADIQDFVRSVFDEILHEPVIVDPNIAGKITVRTGEPVDRAAAVDIVRQMLEMNGAELSRQGKVWRISARSGTGRPGAAARIVPLHNIDAEQARAAVQAFSGGGVNVSALPGNRGLILSGSPAEVEPLVQFAASLDVDQMRGQSFALLPLREAGAVAVAKDMQQVFAAASKNFQAIPVPRMNAILVIASTPSLIQRAREWTGRLDHGNRTDGRIFVYPVQNRRAADLALVLRKMFNTGQGDTDKADQQGAAVSPSFQAQALTTSPDGQAAATPAIATGATPMAALGAVLGGDTSANDELKTGKIAIQADAATNSLVITATPTEWRTISAAISRLDVQPTQVLIEATIAEVRLNDDLRHGVRWFFQSGNHSIGLSDLSNGGVTSSYPGVSYTFAVPNAKVVINALEQVTDVDVVSSPALTVLDNQTATLKVGDQVPIATRSARSVTNPDAPIVNDIELKDTGIILSVTPRVNASGLVQLDISQEVSDVVATTTSDIDSPTIRQRKIDTSVAVASGAEIILGGMIGTSREKGNSGVPFLKDIPLLGYAFKSANSDLRGRTELLIILRPTVMGSRSDVEAVTQAVRAGMQGADAAIGRRVISK